MRATSAGYVGGRPQRAALTLDGESVVCMGSDTSWLAAPTPTSCALHARRFMSQVVQAPTDESGRGARSIGS
jgi:hypothetical protein